LKIQSFYSVVPGDIDLWMLKLQYLQFQDIASKASQISLDSVFGTLRKWHLESFWILINFGSKCIGIMNVISKFIRATWSTVHISVKYRDKQNFWSPETNLGPSTGSVYKSIVPKINCLLRDRPFYLKVGGYGFLFRSEFFFRTTQELEYFFFVAQSANFFSRI
jgi:hypothetical protein